MYWTGLNLQPFAYTPVTPDADQPTTALCSWTLNIYTEAQ